MTIPSFDIGDKIRLGNQAGTNDDGSARAAFTDIAGVVTDPTTVSLEVKMPNGTVLTYGYPTGTDGNLIREGLGRYYYDLSLGASGLWYWTLAGTGTVETSEQGALYVRRAVT